MSTIGIVQPSRSSTSVERSSCSSVFAAGWLRLLIAITSGISITPAFSAWIASPEPGMSTSTTVSAEPSDADLALPDPDRLDEDHVLSGRVQNEHRLERRLRQPAEMAARRPSSG